MSILKLGKPVEINGEVVNEITYDLEELSGGAVENAMKALQKKGYVPTVQELDPIMQAHIFAEASGLDYEDIKRLKYKDYMRATGCVRDFFMVDSVDSQQKNTSEQ
ncbi:phage tail assembly protein [Clostridium intestinale]|uniref:phage tail assembly protein n=1 Tax=Clostridium intestinale TaxID=36845 RepID=UPI002DD61EEB|nr:phage tail assembly protein [Clostridium intestinale]WRY53927.1 phage tail assembly protein [Clostridium intestinale]